MVGGLAVNVLYAAHNIHGYSCFSDHPRKAGYHADPWASRVIRFDKEFWEKHFVQPLSIRGPECTVCGANPDNPDHALKLVQLTRDDGTLIPVEELDDH